MTKTELITHLVKVHRYDRQSLKFSTALQLIKIATREHITAVLDLK